MSSPYVPSLRPLSSKVKPHPFAVFDLETTTDLDRAYLAGFYDGSQYRMFEDLRESVSQPHLPEDADGPVSQFMTWLTSTNTYCRHRIYAHNGGNFDFLYLIRWLLNHQDEFSFTVVPLQSSILCLEVFSKHPPSNLKGRSTPWKWTFLDSFRLMNAPLDKLGLAFTGEGKVKDVDYATLHRDPRRYAYLEQDCKLLFDCLTRFYTLVQNAGGDIGMTAPASAMLSFRRMHLTTWIPVNRCLPNCDCSPEATVGCIHSFTRSAYYGGRVEVFRESFTAPFEGQDLGALNYADVNSMYPWAMLGPVPIELSHLETGWQFDYERKCRDYLGFVECEVTIPLDTYLPPLPFRAKDGRLTFPVGTFSGIWTTEELALLPRVKGKINKITRSMWFRGKPIFAEYVHHWFAYRDKSSPHYSEAMAMVAKLFLNSLYGKFGQRTERQKLWFAPSVNEFEDHVLVPMPDVDPSMFAYTETTNIEPTYVIPHIAAWVTSRSRARLWTLMQDFLDAGHKIYYCDTDSIVTDGPVTDSKALGELKLECQVRKARFVAAKMYFIERLDNSQHVKAKGFSGGFGAKGLTESEFNDLVNHHSKVKIARMRKMREGLRTGERFPSMKRLEKGLKTGILDEKRLHLPDGNTRPLDATGLTSCITTPTVNGPVIPNALHKSRKGTK